ncbi:MAG: glycosyltransferase family 9 protein [Flavobacteriales bacterium AspAUS03]
MPSAQRNILVIRFSSLGDIAVVVPLMDLLTRTYPDDRFIFLTKQEFIPLLDKLSNVYPYPFDPHQTHKGFRGLYRLYRSLKELNIRQIVDIHDVIRSKILRSFFSFSKVSMAVIEKGRKEKKDLVRRRDKRLYPLKPTIERYADVFRSLGFQIYLSHALPSKKKSPSTAVNFVGHEKKETWIGIAPFAHYREKRYPLEKMEKVIRFLNKKNVKIFLFGGGKSEETYAAQWAQRFENVTSLVAKFTWVEELHMIRALDVMLSMDSANMHLASIVGTRVVSIWGATHPFAGFYGYGQCPDDAIQTQLDCRPCSVFGDKICWRGDWACMDLISKDHIVDRLLGIMDQNTDNV